MPSSQKRPIRGQAPERRAPLPFEPEQHLDLRPEPCAPSKRIDNGSGAHVLRLLMLQRLAGNKATALALQRHELPAARQGVGEEDDVIEAPVQRLAAPGRDPVARTWAQRAVPAFGDDRRPAAGGQPWGRPPEQSGGPVLQRKALSKAEAAAKAAEAKKARKELKAFVAGGPYAINDFVPDFTENFGKFDTVYSPAARRLTVNMRVQFTFPDLPVPPVVTKADAAKARQVKAVHAAYQRNFLGQVRRGWSGKFRFRNDREPKAVWGALNPISVRLNVKAVKANPHYVMKAFLNKAGTANVSPNPAGGAGAGTVEFYKGDLSSATQSFTGSAQTGPDEVTRLQRNLPKVRFANQDASIDPKYVPDLQYVGDYLRRMNRPKFTITVVGHANKVGSEARNAAISARRSRAVRDALAAFGVTNHVLVHRGVGAAGATADGAWRKVDFTVKVDKSFSNVQDTTLHEFGHMLGLDDEYVTTRPIQLQHQRTLIAKMLGTGAYGKGNETKYADEVTKVDPLSSASVMYSGDEVRVYHYVTMWQALFNTAAKAASQPTPAFTFADWKVIG